MSRELLVRDAVDRFLARVRQDTDARLQALATELHKIIEGEGQTSRVEIERAAIEIARAVARGGDQARHDLIARIVVTMRHFDEATTLRGILDALTEGAAQEATRVAVLLVESTLLRSYAHRGFGPGLEPADFQIETAPLVAGAVEARQAVKIPAERAELRVPMFMRVPAGHVAHVIPLVVGQQVAALVYVQGPDRAPGSLPGEPVWAEQVEVLVRHASARLETVTSSRTVEVLTHPS